MAMKYNVCIIKPAGYLHSGAFSELAELIAYSLEDLGYESSISLNETYTDSRNIILALIFSIHPILKKLNHAFHQPLSSIRNKSPILATIGQIHFLHGLLILKSGIIVMQILNF